MSPVEAAAELRRQAGAQFDPDVVDALLDLLGEAPPAANPAPGRPASPARYLR
jgi:HD-GYP domain-containing protein (c-di-GMP phosphodiesterase class II)